MMRLKKNNFDSEGFTLIEVFFVLGIAVLIFVSLYGLINISLRVLWENKAREGAVALANQRIELAHNLPYDDVGTVGGVVNGTMIENETVTKNGINYDVYTNVVYIDDEFDGTWETNPVDTLSNDYKRVLVRITWQSKLSGGPVNFYTDIAPRGIESTLGGGTLVLNVFDSEGLPVDQALINVYNDSVVPTVDMNSYTNAQGQLVLPGVLESVENYEITVTKTGYSTDETLDEMIDFTPLKPHLTVFEGQVTSSSYSIDQLGSLNVLVQDINGLPLGNLSLNLVGKKVVGNDGDGYPIYKYDKDLITDGSGVISISNLEWDTYEFFIDAASGYDISETNPVQPFQVLAGESEIIAITLEPNAEHSLIVVVKDINDLPLENAIVHVTNTLGFDDTIVTGSAGQAFFTPMSEATTTVEVTLSGYENYLNEFSLVGYTLEPVMMVVP